MRENLALSVGYASSSGANRVSFFVSVAFRGSQRVRRGETKTGRIGPVFVHVFHNFDRLLLCDQFVVVINLGPVNKLDYRHRRLIARAQAAF